ncbi:DUF226 domain-containing protein (plasmid) [Borreliella turdi]|uniref:DUF226 domain-containing protein n=1 Tax=Borreliella turdi TaxID=57863 RepID=UPI003AF0CAA0
MNNITEKLKERKKYVENIESNKNNKQKNTFNRVEEINDRKIYYTKIFEHLIDFRVVNKGLRLTFQKHNDIGKFSFFNLFSLNENDKFLGIKYGWDNLEKPFFLKKENNKIYAIKKFYYIEFKFKKGSIKCYVQSLRTLLRKKEKENTEYYRFNLEHLKKMEKIVYDFYNKKLSENRIIDRWIQKNQIL